MNLRRACAYMLVPRPEALTTLTLYTSEWFRMLLIVLSLARRLFAVLRPGLTGTNQPSRQTGYIRRRSRSNARRATIRFYGLGICFCPNASGHPIPHLHGLEPTG